MTKNRFAKPPYLPTFEVKDAEKLKELLMLINNKMPFLTPGGIIRQINNLLHRPSRIRLCDLYVMRPLVELINEVKTK